MSLRVCLHSLQLRRSDGMEEDDFKSWSQVSILHRRTLEPAPFWYAAADGPDGSVLSKTSVRVRSCCGL